MDEALPPQPSVPRIESLRVRNFRALRDLELRDLTPLTTFIGPNGSGKSTVFDVLSFLHEAFTTSLRAAVDSRFGLRELRTRGEGGPIEIETRFRLASVPGVLTYVVEIGEDLPENVDSKEQLSISETGDPELDCSLLNVEHGLGRVRRLDGDHTSVTFGSGVSLAVPALGLFSDNRPFVEISNFVSDWYLSDIDATDVRRIPEAGPQRRLSRTGDNVANVLEWLAERHPERLATIEAQLRKRVPRLESLQPIATGDGRSMLQLKDAPFERGIPARYASEGTLSLLAYLTALYGQEPPSLMGFEEPEENLPPQLLYWLTEEFRRAAEEAQVFVNTHSPSVLNALRPEEVRVLYRGEDGFTRSVRAADVRGVKEAMDEGAALGNLWIQGFLRVGDPTKNGGIPGPGF